MSKNFTFDKVKNAPSAGDGNWSNDVNSEFKESVMFKVFSTSVTFFLLVISSHVNALPFVDSDAFSVGDNMAVHDTDTDLVWLDFGVNHGQSFNDVMSQLDTTYADWRLPTEQEVVDLWSKLTTFNGTEAFYSVFDLWGANKTPLDRLPFLCWGYFIDDDGYLGAGKIIEAGFVHAPYGSNKYYTDGQVAASFEKQVVDVLYDGSDYYPFSASGTMEISTLLVKKTSVPVPASLGLLGIAILGLFFARYKK